MSASSSASGRRSRIACAQARCRWSSKRRRLWMPVSPSCIAVSARRCPSSHAVRRACSRFQAPATQMTFAITSVSMKWVSSIDGHALAVAIAAKAATPERVDGDRGAEREAEDEVHRHHREQQAREDARLAARDGRDADPGHRDERRRHGDGDVARVPGVGAAHEGDREAREQQRQHDAGAREVRDDAADRRHHDTIHLDHDEADDGEDREVDPQVAQALAELVAAVGRLQFTLEPQSVKSASQLFRQRGRYPLRSSRRHPHQTSDPAV